MLLQPRGGPPPRARLSPPNASFTLIEILIGVAIIAILAAIAIPMLQDAQRKANYARAALNTRTAVTQAITYGNDFNALPTSLAVLRNSGYANVPDKDPWNSNYKLSSALTSGAAPDPQQDVWICSAGPKGGGGCPKSAALANSISGFPSPGLDGSVGYSSLYGGWSGK